MSALARALLAELDDEALDELAELLAPRILGRMAPARPIEPLLTCAEAAARASLSVETIRRAARSGALPAVRAGRTVRIAPADLSAWLQDAHEPGAAPSRRRARRPKSGRPLADALAAGNRR